MTEKKWQVLERQPVVTHPAMTLTMEQIRLPDGQVINDWPMVKGNDYVNILVFDAAGLAMVLDTYRHGVGRSSWQILAAEINEGESPLEVAQKALDRVGMRAEDWRYLNTLVIDKDQHVGTHHFFLVLNARRVLQTAQLDENRRWIPLNELRRALWDGRIGASSDALAISLGLLALESKAVPEAVAHITAHQRRIRQGNEYVD